MPLTYAHDGTAHRKVKEMHVHDGTAWRNAKKAYIHDGSNWRNVFIRKKKLGGTSLPSIRVMTVAKADGNLYACLQGNASSYSTTKVYKYIEASDTWDAVGSIFTGRAESSPGSGYYYYDTCSLVFYRGGNLYACGNRYTTNATYPYTNSYTTIYRWDGSAWVVESDVLFAVYPDTSVPANMLQYPILYNDELYCDTGYLFRYTFSTGWTNIGNAYSLYWMFLDPGGGILSCAGSASYSGSELPSTVTSGSVVAFGTPPTGYTRMVGPIKLGSDYYAFLWDGASTRTNGVYKLTGGSGTWTLVVSVPNTEYIFSYAIMDDTLYISSITYPAAYHQYRLDGSSLSDITDTDLNMPMLRFGIDNALIFHSNDGQVWRLG
jgi:hypothetical protein